MNRSEVSSKCRIYVGEVSMENDNNFGYEKITILVDNMPLTSMYDKK
jgi:hypothetical protein